MPEITDKDWPPEAVAEPQLGEGLPVGGTPGGDDKGGDDALAEPAPGAWAEAEARASALIRSATGKTLADHLMSALGARPGVRTLAVGAGAGGVALELMQHAPAPALVCIDSKPEWLDPYRERSRELALDAQFAAADLDAVELEPDAFDVVFCHAVLHRVVELEGVVGQIKRALRPGGMLVLVEVVTRNGYAMWPETRDVIQAVWNTLPVKFRLNLTAYTTPLIDDFIWEPDPLPSGTRGARPEDILPLVERHFLPEQFVPYFSMSRRFFDSMYGPNYDLAQPLDAALFNWIWALDLHYLATRRLRPETFFGIYRAV
jgi:ubiquinone/menaquinone biosynthesis C-methylase UbiE